ncbi:MAG TPA: NDP-hexose 4-ketoreductase, partial [Dermatophilaceae bacterium]|nr:NDP-hexose 4-ketoreductase [Dermatophilaceae bacterium]
IAKLDERMKDKAMGIELTLAAKALLAKKGYDRVLGARPLRRTIQRDIEDELSEKLLLGEVKAGEDVKVDTDGAEKDEKFTFSSASRSELDVPPLSDIQDGDIHDVVIQDGVIQDGVIQDGDIQDPVTAPVAPDDK